VLSVTASVTKESFFATLDASDITQTDVSDQGAEKRPMQTRTSLGMWSYAQASAKGTALKAQVAKWPSRDLNLE